MIFVRTLSGESDEVQMIEAESPAAELATAIGLKLQIEKHLNFDESVDQVILYNAERIE